MAKQQFPASSPAVDGKLKKLAAYVLARGVEEVVCNHPCEVIQFKRDGQKRFHRDPALAFTFWQDLTHALANRMGRPISPNRLDLQLSTTLPGDHRYEALMGPSVGPPSERQGLSISIRVFNPHRPTLDDYGLSEVSNADKEVDAIGWREMDPLTAIVEMVKAGRNVIVSGGTSTGKTTFLNLLIEKIPDEYRILSVEDTAELDIPHRDSNRFFGPRIPHPDAITYNEIFDHLMRSRPDIIVAGEVSEVNVLNTVKLMATGHRGFMTTIHSSSVDEVIGRAFQKRGNTAGHRFIDLSATLREEIDLIVQLVRDLSTGRRRITQVYSPTLDHWFLGHPSRYEEAL
ncbi:MAG: Flp pilus assembly complex ATPase component TadA [Rhodospirillales bacterium]|nr:Flp pilus assembly complex ATPase component TadA [Rhodospirillales bacterium]